MANDNHKSKATARLPNGRFAVNNGGGPGRPSRLEEHGGFALAMRQEIEKRKLAPQRMADMAAGVGKYARLGPKFQHQVLMDMLAYAYGRPAQIVSSDVDAELTLVKRVIGISDADV
jgi:hypothetical protein